MRALSAAMLSVGIGLAGLVGTGVAVSTATPANTPFPTHKETPEPQPIPGVPPLSHHDRKKLEKYLEEHPELTVPNTGATGAH